MTASWQPSCTLAALQRRATVLREIRNYFYREQVMEVETPMLSQGATVDVFIDSFTASFSPIGSASERVCYLNTSPEFPMKRLLAAGSGDIYSLNRVFRNGEAGGRHNPEFTMLEWYRTGMDLPQLMDDVASLMTQVARFSTFSRRSYQSLFEAAFMINPHTASDETLQQLVIERVDDSLSGLSRNDCLDLLFSQGIEPALGRSASGGLEGVFVYDYPATMAALAQLRCNEDGHSVAVRFELFVNGVELANGFQELQDADEQVQRFRADQQQRQARGLPVYPYDRHLIEALRHGLPDCSGVALGVDRLLMLMQQTGQIRDVLAFDFERA